MTTHSRPRVSVVLPVRDAEPYLDDTLTSLTRQFDDVRDLQVVVVDDGSTDSTPQIVASYESLLPGLVVLRNAEAVGAATARNQGLVEATGRFVTYLDGDDWLAPGHLRQAAAALEHFGCPVLRHDHVTVRGTSRTLVRAPEPVRDQVIDPRGSVLPLDRSTMVDYPYAWAGMYDRAIARDGLLTFSDGLRTATDRGWIWRLHLDTPRYVVTGLAGVCYRRGVSTSLTQTYDERRLDFTTAFTEVLEIVEADRDTEVFLPKLVRTVLAITSYHLGFMDRMSERTADELVRRSSELISRFPSSVVDEVLRDLSTERKEALRPVVRREADPAADAATGGVR